MSLERDEGVAAALLATPMQHATQNKTIDKYWPNRRMGLCAMVLVNGRGMTGGLARLVGQVYPVHLVCLVDLIHLVYLVSLVQPNKQDKPNKRDRLRTFPTSC